jgi:predicted nuclease of restriction endonuclease-like RecB superfamily
VLTADLVTVRRRGDELRLPLADEARRARVAALAAALAATARQEIGRTRDEVDECLKETAAAFEEDTDGGAGHRKLIAAVGKLVRDGLAFEETPAEAATELRRALFRRVAARRAAGPGRFDRSAILDEMAGERGLTAAALEQGLFADRPGAQRLRAVELPSPAALAAGFELAEAQAVLLRATKVIAEVQARDAASYRHLFRRLKFLRLLPVIQRTPKGHRIEMDGPLSLFQAGARYGLQLALALPAIAACDVWTIEADVRWGAERRALRFRLGGAAEAVGVVPAASLPDELATFVAAFERAATGWTIDPEPAVLDLPGAGLCVPDLAFVRQRDGARVAFELLGFWSRQAVFRRVDLVRAGLPHRILFAASKSLRVGEAVLDDAPAAALYVFTRVLSVRAVVQRLEKLAAQ